MLALIRKCRRCVFSAVALLFWGFVTSVAAYEMYISGGVKKTPCPHFINASLSDASIPFASCEYDDAGNYFLNLTGKAVTNLTAIRNAWYPAVVRHHQGFHDVRMCESTSALPKLWLYLAQTPVLDLAPLKGLPIVGLDISDTAVRDLSPLTNAPLEMLRVRNSAIKDLAPISACPVKYLDIRSTSITNLLPLRRCPIERLWLDGSDVDDLSPLKDLPLRYVSFQNTGVTDTSPLGDMRVLQTHRGGVAHRPDRVSKNRK